MSALTLVPAHASVLHSRAIPVAVGELMETAIAVAPLTLETMYEYDGCGLAAPQVGLNIRLIVWDVGRGPRALVNPVVHELASGYTTHDEGCLSLPGVIVPVRRRDRCKVTGTDPLTGRPDVSIRANGWLARVLQHEVEHLDGILMTDPRKA